MNLLKIAPWILLALLSGCAATPHFFINSWTEEVLPLVTPMNGDNKITGSGFLRQNGGGTVTCAGNDVLLKRSIYFERSPYAKEANSLSAYVRNASDVDPRHYEFESKLAQLFSTQTIRTSCDVDGKFEFQNLASGEYNITTKVYWVVANEGQGGLVSNSISIPEGSTEETYNLVVSNVTRSCQFAFDGCPVR